MNPGECVYEAILRIAFLSSGTEGSLTPLTDTHHHLNSLIATFDMLFSFFSNS